MIRAPSLSRVRSALPTHAWRRLRGVLPASPPPVPGDGACAPLFFFFFAVHEAERLQIILGGTSDASDHRATRRGHGSPLGIDARHRCRPLPCARERIRASSSGCTAGTRVGLATAGVFMVRSLPGACCFEKALDLGGATTRWKQGCHTGPCAGEGSVRGSGLGP